MRVSFIRTHRLRRAALGLGLVALAAASAKGQGRPQTPRVLASIPSLPRDIALDSLAVPVAIDAPSARVFGAVQQIFAELKIPVAIADSTHGIVGNMQFRRSGALGGERFSKYLSCGFTMAGANADYWRLSIAIATFVTPTSATQSTIGTGLVASAQDMGGTAKDPNPCASSGLLEARIVDMVKRRLALP